MYPDRASFGDDFHGATTMKRSRTTALLLMSTAPLLFTACQKEESVQVQEGLYTSVEACSEATGDPSACRTAFAAAPALVEVPGMVPELGRMPAGCRFAPRCRRADETCRETPPPESTLAATHVAACWKPTVEVPA